MSEKKLLPCPFCGGEAEIVVGKFEYQRSPGVEYDYTARCKECASEGDLFYTEEEAIEKWNTRKPLERIVERLEKLNKYEETGDCPKDGMCSSRRCNGCYSNSAIEIVKEEGGLNEYIKLFKMCD